MEEQQQPFAAFVLETLIGRSAELARRWAAHARLAGLHIDEQTANPKPRASHENAESSVRLVQAVLEAAEHQPYEQRSLVRVGLAIGVTAHRGGMPLHRMLKELDLLASLILRAAEETAHERQTHGTSRDGFRVAYRIAEAVGQLRLAAVTSYTQAVSDELRERYRAIRHDLRNPLGTIKSAVALLTDETMPDHVRDTIRVRAMVVRNTSSLDQLIDRVLSDTAAQLRAFDAPRELTTEIASERLSLPVREQSEDIPRSRERPDPEPGAF